MSERILCEKDPMAVRFAQFTTVAAVSRRRAMVSSVQPRVVDFQAAVHDDAQPGGSGFAGHLLIP